jgi:hypothetical protein
VEELKEYPLVLDVGRKDSLQLSKKWCYESWNQAGGKGKLVIQLQKELATHFPFTYSLEKRTLPAYAIVRLPHVTLTSFTKRDTGLFNLGQFYSTTDILIRELKAFVPAHVPVVDKSGYKENIFLNLDGIHDLHSARNALQKIGFDLVPDTVKREAIVVRRR